MIQLITSFITKAISEINTLKYHIKNAIWYNNCAVRKWYLLVIQLTIMMTCDIFLVTRLWTGTAPGQFVAYGLSYVTHKTIKTRDDNGARAFIIWFYQIFYWANEYDNILKRTTM